MALAAVMPGSCLHVSGLTPQHALTADFENTALTDSLHRSASSLERKKDSLMLSVCNAFGHPKQQHLPLELYLLGVALQTNRIQIQCGVCKKRGPSAGLPASFQAS